MTEIGLHGKKEENLQRLYLGLQNTRTIDYYLKIDNDFIFQTPKSLKIKDIVNIFSQNQSNLTKETNFIMPLECAFVEITT
jgi:hypothetical protein